MRCESFVVRDNTAQILFFVLVTQHKPLEYSNGEPYPQWAEVFGFALSLCSMLCIPGYAIFYMIKAPGATWRDRLRTGLTPSVHLRTYKAAQASTEMSLIQAAADGDRKVNAKR